MPSVKAILSVAGEGGGMTLYQEEGGQGRFRVVSSDQTMTFLEEAEAGGPSRSDSGWLATWEEALEKFERWPWPMLVPRHVDPEFADRVLAAIPGVLKRKGVPEGRYRQERWLKACGKAAEEPT
jgi:hypothetical protein